ncbi:MAG TPA: ferric reductase-like transmembrane domain-containing protein [Dehalococcoidia bacterium]|nr:ferric reductase-like transmembrane domain-containing protein [Dehalococcoidia bacterium]
MTGLETLVWVIERAGGFTAFALLTLAVAVGLALSLHWQSPRWPRIINSELHNFLTLLATVFLGVHVLAAWVDPYTHFSLAEVLVPLVSHYRPEWIAFGIVALYLGIAIGISTWLRPKIGYAAWRRLHVLTLAVYALSAVHGIASGTDTGTAWATAVYAGSIGLVGALLAMRVATPKDATGRARPMLTVGSVAALALVTAVLVSAGVRL